MSNQLNDFGLKIFLDRYALKDTKKDTLAPGDTVVVCVNQKTRQREVGTVEELVDNPGNKPRVRIKLLDGSMVTQDWDDVDKPLETWPEQTMARVAGGIAAMETEEKREEWKEKFKWLLDDWRFVPGGRILNAAGTEQALTYFNCFAAETLVHLDTGVVEIGTLTGTHNVLSAGGVYRPAEFKSYGTQRLWCIEFENGEIVHATAEHEWVVLQSGEFCGNPWERLDFNAPRVQTKDLAGKRIPRTRTNKPEPNESVLVVSVAETDRVEEVFCCVEMETHTITIGSGLLTGQCYVIPSPKDSRKGIVETLTNMMEIMSRGGGVGINLSSLRPQHAYVKGVNGRSSGSVSWGGLYSFVTGLIEQGGSRRGALMLMLDAWHPDLFKFIDAKREAGRITNANISIALPDAFMDAVKNDGDWELKFPDTNHPAYNTEWTGDLKTWMSKDYPVIVHETVKAKDIWDKIVASAWASAEPGLLFIDRVNAMSNSHYFSRLICTNPCLTGDTKVALADGRGTATIKELAEAGEDVDVYAIDDKGRLAVRRMRNPRLTGYKQQIYKVTIEGGHTFRTTANHKMILRDGTTKEVRRLRRGDSLWIGHRGVSTYDKAVYGKDIEKEHKYSFVHSCTRAAWFAEHRLMYKEANGDIPQGYHVHHKNHDPLDNRLENLELLPASEHIDEHIERLLGENNPMAQITKDPVRLARYSANMSKATAGEANGRYRWEVSDTELLDCIGELARQLGRQPTKAEWFEYGRENLGLHNITSFRLERLGCTTTSVNELLRLGAERAGVQVTNLKSAVRHEENEALALSQGYRTHIIEGKLHVERTCEVCGSMFIMPYARREVSSCSVECGKQLAVARASVSFQEQADSKLDNMLQQYKALEQKLGRTPMKKEYEAHMWEQGFPCRFGGGKGLPAGYKDLQEQAAVYNHKVVKVELDGFEDVYNGTVDEFHNFCIVVGQETVDRLGGSAELWLGNRQCGEQPLPEWGICNLGAINLSKHVTGTKVDWDTLKQTVRYAVRFLDNVIDATPYFIDENKIQQQRERRVGLGIMGLAEMMIRCEVRYGSKEGNAFIDSLGKFIAVEAYLASADYASEKGAFPEFDAKKLLQSGFMTNMPKNVRDAVKEKGLRNVTLLTVAPTGTTGTMVDTSTGVEPYFAWTYWRKSRLGVNEIEVDIVADYKAKHPETKELPPWFVTAMDLSPEEHVRAQAALQRWIDSALSKTVNAPNNYTIDQTRELYELLYNLGCKGGTIYRDGSRDEQVLMTKKEEPAPAPVKVLEPKPRKRSNPIMTSLSARQMTALGSCYVNVTYDNQHEPLEVFVTSGKAGSDVASLAEGLGRVISMNLRLPSVTSPTERLAELAEQLNGIGGSDSVGFGKNKIKSLPDAVGKALEGICKQLRSLQNPGGEASAPEPEPEPAPAPAPKKAARKAPAADLCPSCGQATYIREEGCRKCTSCGHSACG